ncbi:tRNA glutamyl-Q(34) synthetase GluQRS [Martelella limonii]|uniref:tRNA glutamyl-Q(34) synthetase GluQRS n=1 Tax=Martelella limonii TaxID=1647649 RepID=UPI00158109FC|nr:tRNA glutamyl-Q(34) synthetase GluQRS [Martelella limonii]
MEPAQDRPVFRFAPSPNGYLHLGHAFSAFENQARAEAVGGRLLLRIEDIDQTRATPELEAALIADLAWLGLRFETPYFRQSEHFGDYQAVLERLMAMGVVYPAFLTRGDVRRHVEDYERSGRLWPRDPDGAPLYPATDRERSGDERAALLASGRRHAFRLDMAAALALVEEPLFWREDTDGGMVDVEADPAAWGDVVLSRSDAPSSYHLSVVTDDAAQNVTHVVRGRDLYHATAIHRLLQTLLGLKAPVYRHHRLILGADGRKLSKSNGDTALRQLRADGSSVADILVLLGI